MGGCFSGVVPTSAPKGAATHVRSSTVRFQDEAEHLPTPAELELLRVQTTKTDKTEGFKTCNSGNSGNAADADDDEEAQEQRPESPLAPTTRCCGSTCSTHGERKAAAPQYDAFLSHDWCTDTKGRNNHLRVKQISEGLEARGLKVWFDANNMSDDVQRDMVEGIQASRCLVAFVTQKYLEKVGSKGFDNCKGEFDYARTIEKPMIAVPMETCMQNTKNWLGPVGMWLGTKLYPTSFAESIDDEQLDKLAQKLRVMGLPAPSP